jgi:predicted ATPase
LIGENGSGKSTILECLELLRKSADSTFLSQFYAQHRGMPGLLRKGAPVLELGVVIEDDAGALPRLEYMFALAPKLAGAQVARERLLVGPIGQAEKALVALRRSADRGEVFDQKEGKLVPLPPETLAPDQLVVSSFGRLPPHSAMERLLTALRGIEVQLPFDTLAAWGAQAVERQPTLRGAGMLTPADRLSLLGRNLASAWSALKNINEAHWQETMAMVRLGLGDGIDSINTVPDAGGGYVSLSLTDLPHDRVTDPRTIAA